ncbi:hypothetical protein BGW39_004915 [Mortierella sp. 14UC]|nr:hypothetical protein BGW39_004915 [Mortierella sp. 14UC]
MPAFMPSSNKTGRPKGPSGILSMNDALDTFLRSYLHSPPTSPSHCKDEYIEMVDTSGYIFDADMADADSDDMEELKWTDSAMTRRLK